jgi:hypothetical protein
MKVTLSLDEQILARARTLAQRRCTSLSMMVQEWLEALTAADRSQAVGELERLWQMEEGDSAA